MRPISIRGELLIVSSLLLLLISTACQAVNAENLTGGLPAMVKSTIPAAGALSSPAPANSEALATSDAPATPLPPPTEAAGMPSFALDSPADLTRAALPSPTIPPTSPPTATATLLPTPTSPALRFTLPQEHYWFWRPIREGDSNWTDKEYSYGSTRNGTLRPHHGVEFYVPAGTDVIAAASGEVVAAGNDATFLYGPQANFYGNLVIIEHDARWQDQPVYTLYAHLSDILVETGQHVFEQQLIARSGATGVADGAHLHFEVRVGQNSYESTQNPLLWLYPFPDRGVVVGRVLSTTGELLEEVQVVLSPLESVEGRAHGTTTYAGSTVNGDPLWNENFVVDDVFSGLYQATVAFGAVKFSQEVTVQPFRTALVEIVVDLTAVPTPTPTAESEE